MAYADIKNKKHRELVEMEIGECIKDWEGYHVTRVANGWIYRLGVQIVFVPYRF